MAVCDPEGLRTLLKAARDRCSPAEYPELTQHRLRAGLQDQPLTWPTGRERGLTQEEVSLLAGLPLRTVGRLERGQISAPPDHVLREVARVLRLTEEEWGVLWLAVHGQQPSPSTSLHPGEASAVPAVWHRLVQMAPVAAYISDLSWDVVVSNAKARELWGTMPDNIILWILGEPTARETVMIDWAGHWAPLAVSQLHYFLLAHPEHARLHQIRDQLLRDEAVRELWEQRREPYLHPDGDRRRMRHAVTGEVMVMDSAAAEPLGAPGTRVIFMEMTPEEA